MIKACDGGLYDTDFGRSIKELILTQEEVLRLKDMLIYQDKSAHTVEVKVCDLLAILNAAISREKRSKESEDLRR